MKVCLVVRSSMDVFERFTAKSYATHRSFKLQVKFIAFFAGPTQ